MKNDNAGDVFMKLIASFLLTCLYETDVIIINNATACNGFFAGQPTFYKTGESI
jgi:hypothetical protein